MKKRGSGYFFWKLTNKKRHFPMSGMLELTNRCSLRCVHCYCRTGEAAGEELSTGEWKGIIDMLRAEGCLRITFTGGDPAVRDDFLELYSYAKRKGFLVILFTNGHSLTRKAIGHLAKQPPLWVEITLNGITPQTYESITQVKDSFPRVIENIKLLAKNKVKLLLKSNCLKQNKDEIGSIKAWTEELLGKSARSYRFKYDPMIFPRRDGDRTPCDFRLSSEELIELRKQDADIWEEYQKGLHSGSPRLRRDRDFLYPCDAWTQQFFISPQGRLKFCGHSNKFSVDLKTTGFREGFYNVFPRILNERFKTASKCRDCSLRPLCYHCPARAFLETGDEEAPVPYYCQLAETMAKERMAAAKDGGLQSKA